jgi:hypothetical protein
MALRHSWARGKFTRNKRFPKYSLAPNGLRIPQPPCNARPIGGYNNLAGILQGRILQGGLVGDFDVVLASARARRCQKGGIMDTVKAYFFCVYPYFGALCGAIVAGALAPWPNLVSAIGGPLAGAFAGLTVCGMVTNPHTLPASWEAGAGAAIFLGVLSGGALSLTLF